MSSKTPLEYDEAPSASPINYKGDAKPAPPDPALVEKKKQFVLDFVEDLLDALTVQRLEDPQKLERVFQQVTRKLTRKYKMILGKAEINGIYQDLVKQGLVSPSFVIESLTKNKSVRSRSGVLPISVATDGNTFSCAYNCHFCPNECVALGAPRDMSRSYLSSEGTFIRGAIEDFSAAGQVWRRLLELELMGHPPDKLEMIILGGTWDSYPAEYRDEFIHQIFYACNVFHLFSLRVDGPLTPLTKKWVESKPFPRGLSFDAEGVIKKQLRPPLSLDEEKKLNQEAPCARVIGIVLETRPDQISKFSLQRKRRLGCTRVQLGIQHTDNEILKLNNRGHGVEKSVQAIRCARDACFKVDGHLMPDLPGTTKEKDMEMLKKVFGGDDLQLDYCKLYPCLDLPYTETRKWKEAGTWKPMAEHQFGDFLDILRYGMAIVPPWTRVNRVQRDFPEAQEKNGYLGFVSDNIRSNLQQMVVQQLEKHGQACYDIRSREIKNAFPSDAPTRARVFVRVYRANQGTEFFISVEIPNRDAKCKDDAILMGLLRLRLADADVVRLGRGRSLDENVEEEEEEQQEEEEEAEEETKDQDKKEGDEHANQTSATKKPRKQRKPRDKSVPFHFLPEFAERPLAKIRELHVYGNIIMTQEGGRGGDEKKKKKEKEKENSRPDRPNSQHTGVGKFLMASAERIACLFGFRELAVISGVGVRGYYSRLGYLQDSGKGEYMIKSIKDSSDFLPLTFFGQTLSDQHLLLPLSSLNIPSSCLHSPDWSILEKSSSFFTPSPSSWSSVYSYPDIQGGKAQLVIIRPTVEEDWRKNPLVGGLFIMSLVVMLIAIAFAFW